MDDVKIEFSNLVRFVKPSSKPLGQEKDQELTSTAHRLDGKDVSRFYRDLVSSKTKTSKQKKCGSKQPSTVHKSVQSKASTKMCTNTQNLSSMTATDLLKSAQYGDIQTARKCLNDGVDVNSCDNFGWTALMCAACGGNGDVVQLLLEFDADINMTDSAGRDARSMAQQSGHHNIADIIKAALTDRKSGKPSRHGHSSSTQNSDTKKTENKGFYCSVCKSQVKESTKSKHSTSTVHLFNLKLKPKVDTFLEHSANKGYQLMLKSGWDGQKGLGPQGEGQKYPVKTILKRDRKCLGAQTNKQPKAKVTHFGPGDTSAVQHVKKNLERKMTVRTLSKRAKKAQERKNKKWERNLRSEFNSDIILN